MLSGIVTAVLLTLFIVGWIYVWSPRRREEFDAAARMPLDDTPPSDLPTRDQRTKEHSA